MRALAEDAEAELAAIGERHPEVTVFRGGAAFGGEPAARAVARLRTPAQRPARGG